MALTELVIVQDAGNEKPLWQNGATLTMLRPAASWCCPRQTLPGQMHAFSLILSICCFL